MEQPVILAISSCRVVKYKDDIQLLSTAATHWYLNPNIPEVSESLPEYRRKHNLEPPLNIIRRRPITDGDPPDINRQPLHALLTRNPETYKHVTFTTDVTITTIKKSENWYYKACTDCNKKLYETNGVYECYNDGAQPNPNYRYSFRATATDGTAAATFVLFTPAADKFTEITCRDLADIHPDPSSLPPHITATIGKRYTLQYRYRQDTTSKEFLVDYARAITPTNPEETGSSHAPATPHPQQEATTHATNTPLSSSPAATTTSSAQHTDTDQGTSHTAKRSLFQEDKSEGKKRREE